MTPMSLATADAAGAAAGTAAAGAAAAAAGAAGELVDVQAAGAQHRQDVDGHRAGVQPL